MFSILCVCIHLESSYLPWERGISGAACVEWTHQLAHPLYKDCLLPGLVSRWGNLSLPLSPLLYSWPFCKLPLWLVKLPRLLMFIIVDYKVETLFGVRKNLSKAIHRSFCNSFDRAAMICPFWKRFFRSSQCFDRSMKSLVVPIHNCMKSQHNQVMPFYRAPVQCLPAL